MSLMTASFRAASIAVVIVAVLGGCFGRGRTAGPKGSEGRANEPAGSDTKRSLAPGVLDPVTAYGNAGLLAAGEPLPFVGNVRYMAGASPDTTLVLVTLSLANSALTFTGEGDGQRASYGVTIAIRQGSTSSVRSESHETVRVVSFKEATRTDESVIFQRFLKVAPGQYVLAVSVRDDGSSRNNSQELLITVPRLAAPSISSPVAVYEASLRESKDSIPDLVANPRATAIFGRDSVIKFYIESYGLTPGANVVLAAVNDKRATVWRDTVAVSQHQGVSAQLALVPVARLGVGQLAVIATIAGSTDTVRSPLFITFSDDWAVSSFEAMLDLLRYFTTSDRLRALRDTAPEFRADAWSAFWRATDPVPTTREHEAMRDYFTRIRVANERFREEGISGWLTDRGRVFVTLGEPDQVVEQGETNLSQRGRAQIWTYNEYQVQLVFIDQTGFGRWRLITGSEGDFESVAQRERSARG